MKLKLSTSLSLRTDLVSSIIVLVLTIGLWAILTLTVHASYAISPLLIEHSASPRDMYEESIKITNNTTRKLRIFPSVNEITLGDEGEIKEFIPPSMSDNSTSVTSWIEVTRGRVEINPGETIKLPVMIAVSPTAKPGSYYAFLGLAEGSKRDDAEAKVMAGSAPGVVIKIELADTANEYLRLSSYSIRRFVGDESKANINYQIENIGDIPVTPKGEIILYDVKGQEITSIPVNSEAVNIPPGENIIFSSPLPEVGFMGKYKAFLSVQYGSSQAATIYDTIYFTVLPLQTILIIFSVLMLVTAAGAFYYHRSRSHATYEEDEEVSMYIRSGSASVDNDHDINLKQ